MKPVGLKRWRPYCTCCPSFSKPPSRIREKIEVETDIEAGINDHFSNAGCQGDCEYCMNSPTDFVSSAEEFARTHHEGQRYSESLPYSYHLECVVEVLQRFGVEDPELIAAGWLHDVVEDCAVPIEEIEGMFGTQVSHLVWAVTNEPGVNRKERHLKTYPKIKIEPGATTLKLADRIANVESPGKRAMYQKEHAGFRAALYVAGENEAMWSYLDSLLGDHSLDSSNDSPIT